MTRQGGRMRPLFGDVAVRPVVTDPWGELLSEFRSRAEMLLQTGANPADDEDPWRVLLWELRARCQWLSDDATLPTPLSFDPWRDLPWELDARAQQVVESNPDGMEFAEIGAELGVSKAAAHAICKRALEKLASGPQAAKLFADYTFHCELRDRALGYLH